MRLSCARLCAQRAAAGSTRVRARYRGIELTFSRTSRGPRLGWLAGPPPCHWEAPTKRNLCALDVRLSPPNYCAYIRKQPSVSSVRSHILVQTPPLKSSRVVGVLLFLACLVLLVPSSPRGRQLGTPGTRTRLRSVILDIQLLLLVDRQQTCPGPRCRQLEWREWTIASTPSRNQTPLLLLSAFPCSSLHAVLQEINNSCNGTAFPWTWSR